MALERYGSEMKVMPNTSKRKGVPYVTYIILCIMYFGKVQWVPRRMKIFYVLRC